VNTEVTWKNSRPSACRLAKHEIYDINAIQKLIPHRYPFLMIDKVVITKNQEGYRIQMRKRQRNFFQGISPGSR